MIVAREYKPNENDLIYHYCDANAFHSICSNRKLWFNDLHSMNDALEMHWGYSIWEKAASRLIDKVGKDFLDQIDEVMHFAGLQGLVLASCFSTDKDVLSQWRAYADDGKGYVIGFDANELFELPIRPLKVLYDEEQQIKEAMAVIMVLFEEEKNKNPSFKTLCYLFGYDLSAFKNPAFIEEKEIRLIHLLDFKESNGSLKLIDEGGQYFGEEKTGEQVKFRMKQNIPTPYIELDFSNNNNISPIKEVIIGPKNDIMPTGISIYLETIGIGKVKISRSRASYR